MDKKTVTVFVIPGQESGYVAFFPFFPSCTTQGETLEETLRNAKEALELALEDMDEEDWESLPSLMPRLWSRGRLRYQRKPSKGRLAQGLLNAYHTITNVDPASVFCTSMRTGKASFTSSMCVITRIHSKSSAMD